VRKIFKYAVPHGDPTDLQIPRGAKIVCVYWQGDSVKFWAEVNPESFPEVRRFCIVATGQEIPTELGSMRTTTGYEKGHICPWSYVGTAFDDAAKFVWHLHEYMNGTYPS